MKTVKRKVSAMAVVFFTAFSMALASGMPVCASENTYTSDGTANIPITATVESSYTVVLPSTTQTLVDDDNDGKYTGTIGYDVYGKINTDKALIVCTGDGAGISYATMEINSGQYAGHQSLSTSFHMTGTDTSREVTGYVKQTVLRFLAGGAATEALMDRNIPTAKSATAPFEATMEIEIPYTDTFTGNMPFNFGLVDL